MKSTTNSRHVARLGLGLTIIAASLLAACSGGGGGSSNAAPAGSSLNGVAAVGSPIVGGTINVSCVGSSAPLSTLTSSSGAWQVSITGQTLPCAVEVNGGTINGQASTVVYHSIAVAPGTVNVTPLTDLLVANLVGSAALNTWFAGLSGNGSALTTITQADVDAAVARLRSAYSGLTALASNNPISMTLVATPGTVGDDMLSALAAALVSTGVTHAALLANAAVPAFSAPVSGFNNALLSAYLGTPSGAASGGSGSGGNVCIAEASYQGNVVGKLCFTDLPADFTCGQAGIEAAGGSLQQSVGTYSYRVAAACPSDTTITFSLGGSGGGTTTAIPSAPTGASASATSATQISISWTSVSGATAYNVYRSTSANVQTTAANKITATTQPTAAAYADTGLSAATTYYYKITAVNSAGESSASNEISATTAAASSSAGAGSAVGSGLYSAVLPADSAAFLALLDSACATKSTLGGGGTTYGKCTQNGGAYATNLVANMWTGGLPHQTGGSIVSGPTSHAPGTAKVDSSSDNCTVVINEPYLPILEVARNGSAAFPSASFTFRGTDNDTITVTGGGVVSEYTMTDGAGHKIEVHPNLTLFNATSSGSEAVVGSVDGSGMWSSYFICK